MFNFRSILPPREAGRVRGSRTSPSIASRSLWLAAVVTLVTSLASSPAAAAASSRKPALDHSGRTQVGWASYYARKFSGRRMADGTPMRPESNNAASRTLPFGTTAEVTNLRDGRTAIVTIRDRGPFAKGRIIDLSPRTARQLGMLDAGVVKVAVTPISVPQRGMAAKSVVALNEPDLSDSRCVASIAMSRVTTPSARPC